MNYKNKGFPGRPLVEGVQGKRAVPDLLTPTIKASVVGTTPRVPPTGGTGTAKPMPSDQPKKNS